MANYLQRIAASGARTSSLAKPPAAGRGLIPPFAPLLRAAISEETAEPLGNGPVPLTPAAPETGLPPGSGVQPGLAQEAIPERESVESSPPPVTIPQRIAGKKSASGISVRAPEALRASTAPGVREPSIHKVAEETIRTFAPRNLVSRTASNQLLPQTKAAPASPVQPDSAVREISQQHVPQAEPVRYSPAQERVQIEESMSMIRPAKTGDEAAPEIKAPVPRLPTTTSAHADDPADRGRTKLSAARAEIGSASPIRSAEKPAPAMRSSQVLPSSQTQSLRHPGHADSRRRSQISIGRIDVQVNNQTPPQPANARPASVPARMNSLEQRYLGRFFLGL